VQSSGAVALPGKAGQIDGSPMAKAGFTIDWGPAFAQHKNIL
jgi:hypothetical protein